MPLTIALTLLPPSQVGDVCEALRTALRMCLVNAGQVLNSL